MAQANLSGMTDDAILIELERKELAKQQAKGAGRRVAWHATFLCAITLVAMLVMALISRDTSNIRWIPYALIPFFCYLPTVFFRLAKEQQQMAEQIRELRNRVEELEKVGTE